MLDIRYSSQFKKDIRRIKRQGKDLEKLREAISLLVKGEAITGVTSLVLKFSIYGNLRYIFKGIQPENSRLKT